MAATLPIGVLATVKPAHGRVAATNAWHLLVNRNGDEAVPASETADGAASARGYRVCPTSP